MHSSALLDNGRNTPEEEALGEGSGACEAARCLFKGTSFDGLIDKDDPVCGLTSFACDVSASHLYLFRHCVRRDLPSFKHPNGSPKLKSPIISKVQKLNQDTIFAASPFCAISLSLSTKRLTYPLNIGSCSNNACLEKA
jgi:hypothetical protein